MVMPPLLLANVIRCKRHKTTLSLVTSKPYQQLISIINFEFSCFKQNKEQLYLKLRNILGSWLRSTFRFLVVKRLSVSNWEALFEFWLRNAFRFLIEKHFSNSGWETLFGFWLRSAFRILVRYHVSLFSWETLPISVKEGRFGFWSSNDFRFLLKKHISVSGWETLFGFC